MQVYKGHTWASTSSDHISLTQRAPAYEMGDKLYYMDSGRGWVPVHVQVDTAKYSYFLVYFFLFFKLSNVYKVS